MPVKKYTGTSSSVIQTAPAVKLKSSSSIEQVSSIKALSSDPLAEFYEQAKEELEVRLPSYSQIVLSDVLRYSTELKIQTVRKFHHHK